jgi:Sec-independent protein translocase protein TatA
MFDSVSWGELTVVIGLGLFVIGKKDLPKAAHLAGTQVGRVVGLLQGARARADRFAAHNELRQLQRELQSGLRELDMVKSELAVSMSGQSAGGIGSSSVMNSSRRFSPSSTETSNVSARQSSISTKRPSNIVSSSHNRIASTELENHNHSPQFHHHPLPPATQTIAAVAEEEWVKQGIAFKSRAELGAGLTSFDASTSGSVLLANMIQQSLIFDQYDRVVAEQDEAMQSRIERAKENVLLARKGEKQTSSEEIEKS